MSPNTVNTLTVSQLNGLSVGQVSALLNSPNSVSFSPSIKTSLISISQNQPINLGNGGEESTTKPSINSGFKSNIDFISLIFCFLFYIIIVN
jgi:hypothetical protein